MSRFADPGVLAGYAKVPVPVRVRVRWKYTPRHHRTANTITSGGKR